MVSDKDLFDMPDRTTIDINDTTEVDYVHHMFPWFSRKEIVDAIKTKGPDRDQVTAYLDMKSNSGKQQNPN